MNLYNINFDSLKPAVDVVSVGTVIATIMGWLPAIAAFFTIIWTIMRIVNEWPAFVKRLKNWWR